MKSPQFKICYRHKDQYYLASQLFDDTPIKFEWRTKKDNLSYQYKYDFMPNGILSQLIVKIHTLLGNYIPEEEISSISKTSKISSKEKIDILLFKTMGLEEGQHILKIGQEEIRKLIDNQYELLIQLPTNQANLNEIESTISKLMDNQSEEIMDDLKLYLDIAFNDIKIKELENFIELEEILRDLHKSNKWESKVKLGVPLLNLIGIKIETETKFNLQKFLKELDVKIKDLAIKNGINL